MLAAEVLTRLGGVASRAALVAATSRTEVDRALREGVVVAAGRGRYVLAGVDDAAARAHAVGGALCLTSAALHHGWKVKTVPELPHVAVGRGRRIADGHHVQLHRHDLHPSQLTGIATDPETTLTMCLRSLPFDEALCVADSFLGGGGVPAVLRRVAAAARGPGSPQVRRVAADASPDAANPFESTLRAIALDVDGLDVEPQLIISTPVVWARPDLVDRHHRIVLEADSFAWHGDRAALHRDANRYNRLVASGWRVLRFSWEQVMFHPDEVRELLRLLVHRHTEVPDSQRHAA